MSKNFLNRVIAGAALGGVAFAGAALSGTAIGGTALLSSAPTVAVAETSKPKFDDHHKRDLNFTYAYPKRIEPGESPAFVQICEKSEAAPYVEIVGTGVVVPQDPGTTTTVADLLHEKKDDKKKKKFDHDKKKFDHDKFKHEDDEDGDENGDEEDGDDERKFDHDKRKKHHKKGKHLWAYFGFASPEELTLAPGVYALKGSCGSVGKLIVEGDGDVVVDGDAVVEDMM